MEIYKVTTIDNDTFLLLPIDADVPLSYIIDQFNKTKLTADHNVIIDLLVYVGNRDKRFKICKSVDGNIQLNSLKTYYPNNFIINKSYDLFSEVPDGIINRIIMPSIRKEIINHKNKNII